MLRLPEKPAGQAMFEIEEADLFHIVVVKPKNVLKGKMVGSLVRHRNAVL